MSERDVRISVVVAAYNEEPVLARNAERILAVLSERPEVAAEFVLVDDGSRDATGRIMEDLSRSDPRVTVARLPRNRGQGKALRTGFDLARGEVLVTLDADLSYGPEYVWKLYDALLEKKADIMLASAYAKGGTVRNVPFHRHFLSRFGNRYLAWMSSHEVSTLTCAVRAYRREVFDELHLSSDGMGLHIEILMKAAMRNMKVEEIPADLAWEDAKKAESGLGRVSKMRILGTVKLYLQLGWLSRPAKLVFLLGLLLLAPGLYMAAWLVANTLGSLQRYLLADQGFRQSISLALRDMFVQNTYSFAVSGALILTGLLIILFSLIFLQNKFYFEELYQINQGIMKRLERLERQLTRDSGGV